MEVDYEYYLEVNILPSERGIFYSILYLAQTKHVTGITEVSTHVALDHQTYSALDQHTQIT